MKSGRFESDTNANDNADTANDIAVTFSPRRKLPPIDFSDDRYNDSSIVESEIGIPDYNKAAFNPTSRAARRSDRYLTSQSAIDSAPDEQDPLNLRPRQHRVQVTIDRLIDAAPRSARAFDLADDLIKEVSQYTASETSLLWPEVAKALSKSGEEGDAVAQVGRERADQLLKLTYGAVNEIATGRTVPLEYPQQVSDLFGEEQRQIIEYVVPELSPKNLQSVVKASQLSYPREIEASSSRGVVEQRNKRSSVELGMDAIDPL